MNKKKYSDSYYSPREIENLKELIDSSADIFSNRKAFLVKDKQGGDYKPITFSQFKMDIDALGTALIELGLKAEKVAIIGDNSYEWVVSYLATTNGTGVVVPIDRELKANEIANLLERANVKALIYSRKLKGTIDQVLDVVKDIPHIIEISSIEESNNLSYNSLIDRGKELITQGNRDFIEAKINNKEMCSLLFTSGTTGLAKGVMLSHENIAANVYNMSKYVKIVDEGIGLSVLPMHHSYEMTCHVLTGLYQGIAIAICEGLKYIQKNLEESSATVMLGVPLIFENMHKKVMKSAEASGRLEKLQKAINLSKKLKLYNNQTLIRKIFKDVHKRTGNNVWQFISGGAGINAKVVEDFEAMGFPTMQGYGMTENAPIIAVNRDRCSRAGSVGHPIPGTEVLIKDPNEEGIGEIVCKGPSVMLGYYNDEEETNKIIKDGWLYTGDYGCFDREGFLYVSGRKKSVIVTKNGKNIFPEEIEFYLYESDYIEEALVYGQEDEKSGDVIVSAEIFPCYEAINSIMPEAKEEDIKSFLKEIVDKINEDMPLYKGVKRIGVRDKEFEKTTTRKIKRHTFDVVEKKGKEEKNV